MSKFSKYYALACVAAFAGAQAVAQSVSVDEFGNGFFGSAPMPGVVMPDPSGGVPVPVLVYTLPPGLAVTAGDVLILEPGGQQPELSDVIRFDGQGHLIFYSDGSDGIDEPADVPIWPDQRAPLAFIFEVGPEGFNWADYKPDRGMPGFFVGTAGEPSYKFISDIPEPAVYPAAFGLLALGAGVFVRARAKRA